MNNANDNKNLRKEEIINIPSGYCWQFVIEHQKAFLLYITMILVTTLAYFYCPSCYQDLSKKLKEVSAGDFSLNNYQLTTSKHYIQSHDPFVYSELMKQLRQIQKVAMYLHLKQQVTERKANELQRQMLMLKTIAKTKQKRIRHLNEMEARQLISDALLVYDADKLGLRDYALESLGGSIMSTPNTKACVSRYYVIYGFTVYKSLSNPRRIIQPNVQPGQCFAFQGTEGRIRIQLTNYVLITAVTLEHASNSLLTDVEMKSAPKDFQIIGLEEETSESGTLIGLFTYSIEGPPRQTFLMDSSKNAPSYFTYIEFNVLNNYGNDEYTCVYRIRIHGSDTF